MNLHMKTTNQVYGDFEYVSHKYRNINQPIYMTTVPPVVDDAYRYWKREWLPTINHDYGYFYRVLAERCRSQKLKTPDAWSYNIHKGSYSDIKCKHPECLKDTCTTSCWATGNIRDYKRFDHNRLKMTDIQDVSVSLIDKYGRATSIMAGDDGYHHLVHPCTERTLTAGDINRVNVCISNHDGTRFRLSAVPRFFHFASHPNQSKARMRSTYPGVMQDSELF